VNPSSPQNSNGRPSLAAVAQRAGVALATASYALRNSPKISEETRTKVREAAEALGYRTNAAVARLMAELPEIGTISNKAIAKLVGVAPIANDTGKRKGRRPVRGGRAAPRALLFTIAEIVRRHVPDFAQFHQKLSQAGKAKKVVRVALARKLLVRLNAKARDVRRQLELAA